MLDNTMMFEETGIKMRRLCNSKNFDEGKLCLY